jgi:group I intron endonuclease
MRDMSGKNNPMYGKPGTFKGKHHSDESKKKLSQARIGKFKGLENHNTKLFTIDNNILDIHLENILVEEALKITEIKKSTLYQTARTRIPFKDWKIGYIEDKGKPFNQREKKISYRQKLKLGIISEDTTPIEGRIYVHKNKINGKYYVGQTTQQNIEDRWRDGKGYKVNQVFKRAIDKYGWENFEHTILPEIFKTQKELNEAEIRYIEKYDSIKNGYNILPGGFSNPMANPESREKARKATTGLKRTPEQIERIRQSKLNMDPEKKEKLRQNLSEMAKKRIGDKNSFYGKTHSEETRKKLSEKMTGKNKGADSYKSRKIICNETKEIYVSIRDAFEKTGIPTSSISNDCRNLYNKRKKERITFSYLED